MKRSALILFFLGSMLWADYPDQHRVIRAPQMWTRISSNSNIVLSEDGQSLQLAEGVNSGYFTLLPDTLPQPFDRGLPSWNGHAAHANSGFKVSIRFPTASGWSPWLTLGYWKNYVWTSYGSTSYSGGAIDIDYVVLEDFQTVWQWRVELKRQATGHPSPTLEKLSLHTSDERTTENLNYTNIVNDDPPQIFYSTEFVCQYNVDPEIGPSICSPTSTVLALRSYGFDVDAYTFAVDNYDDYWNLFGVWPRAIQNASAFPVDGAVTRYRSWSQAYDTLAAGGRVVMSVGPPLYTGHLMMLAGFDAQGDPIVHDPARQNGYAYEYNKSSLSHSWFDKGGVAYTFFPKDTSTLSLAEASPPLPGRLDLLQNYPNPFNPETRLRFFLHERGFVRLSVFDIQGRELVGILEQQLESGLHEIPWNAAFLPAGVYLLRLEMGLEQQSRRITLLK